MIKLTRLDRQEIALNCDLIVSIEAHPDTTLRLTTGESLLVLESVDDVVQRIADYRSSVLRGAGWSSLLVSGALPAARGLETVP
jgi:flagellar protein FlbD